MKTNNLHASRFLKSSIAILGFTSIALARPSPASSSSTTPSITWTNCTASDPAGLDCGSIQVPLDHDNPTGDNITLVIARLKAPNATRVGSLVYNPGGPGGAGTESIFAVAQLSAPIFSSELLSHYDILGLDPRGVGLSASVKCDPDLWNNRKSIYPTDEQEFNDMVAATKTFGASCANLTGPLLNHLDTTSVAKDIELVRVALNEGKLNYFAQSYGSQIGEQYTELFPEKINRMALDGILDHSQSEIAGMNTEGQTYSETLQQFFNWCNTSTSCTFHGKDAAAIWDSLIAEADSNPIPAPGCLSTGLTACRPNVTGEDIQQNVQGMLQVQNTTVISTGWPNLSEALFEAVNGNATLLSVPLAMSETDPIFASISIACQDWLHSSTTFAEISLKTHMLQVISPRTRGVSASYMISAQCIGWPAPVVNPQHTLSANAGKAPPILMVNSFWDPATSIVWANGVREQLPTTVLATRNGVGHTSYQLFGKGSEAIDTFLINGTLPKDGTIFST